MNKLSTKANCLECDKEYEKKSMILCAEGYVCIDCSDELDLNYETCRSGNCDQRLLIDVTWKMKYSQSQDVRVLDGEHSYSIYLCLSCGNQRDAEIVDNWLKIYFTKLTGKEEAMKVGFVIDTFGVSDEQAAERYGLPIKRIKGIMEIYREAKKSA